MQKKHQMTFLDMFVCELIKTFKYIKDQNRVVKYRVLMQQDEDGIFVAKCPSLPGCISQGTTREEALVNTKDAVNGYLQV